MKDISQDDLEERLSNVAKRPGLECSVVEVGEKYVGATEISIMAGPCAVESREQIFDIAKHIKEIGASILRGGVYKPITFPGVWGGSRGS